jgi:hypothetical protein
MKIKSTLIAAAVALVAQGALLQSAAAAGKATGKYECYDEAAQPKPASDKSRAAVKAEIGGKAVSCYEADDMPAPKSTAKRGDVKAEAKAEAGKTVVENQPGAPAKK